MKKIITDIYKCIWQTHSVLITTDKLIIIFWIIDVDLHFAMLG